MRKVHKTPSGEARSPMDKAMEMTLWQSARTDPQGSWTGTPANPDEVPVRGAGLAGGGFVHFAHSVIASFPPGREPGGFG